MTGMTTGRSLIAAVLVLLPLCGASHALDGSGAALTPTDSSKTPSKSASRDASKNASKTLSEAVTKSTSKSTSKSKSGSEPMPASRPKVVLVFDKECQIWCNKVKPIVQQLEQTYLDKVDFVALDTSTDSFATSMSQAQTLGLSKFLSDNRDYAPVVGVFSARGKIVKQLVGPKNKSIYEDAIAKALSK